ncbi:MAG: mechanosensitive ion channel [Mangrovicoccus sp.]|nr:mechanosensitive ion channel [Mangrovicoccus sp.]
MSSVLEVIEPRQEQPQDPISETEEITQNAISEALGAAEEAAIEAASGEGSAPEISAEDQNAMEEAAEAAEDSGDIVENTDALNWNGAWRSFWRGGQALLTLSQDGDQISGTYNPGDGTVAGKIDGIHLIGTWAQPGAEGVLEFAMAPDGQSFVGRFGNGEYWNGVRLADVGLSTVLFGKATPNAAMSSFISAENAAQDGDALAEILIREYVSFGENDADTLRDQNARLAALIEVIDASTFRLLQIPQTGKDGRAEATLRIAGTEFTYALELTETAPEEWALVVPSLAEIGNLRENILSATEAPTLEDLRADRAFSPRQAIRDFIRGTNTWADGGKDLALSTMDLSGIPENLRGTDGPIAAEYLRQVLIRLGHFVRQEVPNDPNHRQNILLYENAKGKIELAPYTLEEEEGQRWMFTAASLERAPNVFQVMQNLPLADGVTPPPALTEAFALRSQIRAISPNLLKRSFLMENWQWLAIAACLLASLIGAWVISRTMRWISRRTLSAGNVDPDTVRLVDHVVGWPVVVFAMGGALTLALRRLGLPQNLSEIANVIASALLVIGGTYFFYYLVSAIINSLARSAQSTDTKFDDIAAIIGGGLAKIAILVGGIIALAELLSLPYEGVIAALGVGGLAFGIAARDAVANFIGAGMLVADRPFKKGDFVSIGGYEGTVEDVGMRSTRLRTADDSVLTMPNAQISEGMVSNMGQRRRRQLTMTLGLTYETSRAKLEEFVSELTSLLDNNPLVLPNHRVVIDNFGASSIDIDVLAYLRTPGTPEYAETKHNLMGDIIDLTEKVGVEFAFPSQTLYFAEGAENDQIRAAG